MKDWELKNSLGKIIGVDLSCSRADLIVRSKEDKLYKVYLSTGAYVRFVAEADKPVGHTTEQKGRKLRLADARPKRDRDGRWVN